MKGSGETTIIIKKKKMGACWLPKPPTKIHKDATLTVINSTFDSRRNFAEMVENDSLQTAIGQI